MSKIEVNTVDVQCGSTLTLGSSGKTVQLATGASQSGFGRTGTVDWQTGSIKTATFTATSGEGYFCNTTSSSFTVNLPAGSAGAIVSIQDYNNTFDTNSLTVNPNGSEKINGGEAGGELTLSDEGQGITLVYVDSTVGWRSVHENEFNTSGAVPAYVTATGGNSTATCGDFKIHTFTGPGTFTVSCGGNSLGSNSVEYIVVAGGGAGGGQYIGGGGGAGGFRFASPTLAPATYPAKPLAAPANLPVSAQGYPITVGGGGTGNGSAGATESTSGNPSTFSTITSTGGGFGKQDQPGYPGASTNPRSPNSAGNGGSGGGAANGCSGSYGGGNGNTPPVSPAQGKDGGDGRQRPSGPGKGAVGNYVSSGANVAGGGGGAMDCGAIGEAPPSPSAGSGGNGGVGAGVPNAFGTSGQSSGGYYYFSGGGGGSRFQPGTVGTGGLGGGGAAVVDCANGTAGTANTGGGGGGTDSRNTTNSGGNGGSGIVIIRYKFQ